MHTIRLEDINYEIKTEIAGSHGKGSNKSLFTITNPCHKRMWFVVSDHKVDVYKGSDIEEAIILYNRLS